MDILNVKEWFEPTDELHAAATFICGDVHEELSSIDQADETNSIPRSPPLMPTAVSVPHTENSVAGNLLRSHSLNEIHHIHLSPYLSRELPCLPRSEVSRCQSVFPALTCSAAATSHVEIASEMPRYLLQEDEALTDEVPENATASELHPGIPAAVRGQATNPHIKSPYSHKSFAGIEDSSMLSESMSPSLAVQFPCSTQVKTPVWSVNATPISIAANTRVCDKKKRRHGGGWPKGKSRKKASNLSLPKPPLTGYAIFQSERRQLVQEKHTTCSVPLISKLLGQMWSQLSSQAKKAYYIKAEKDRARYVSEIKTYFVQSYKGASTDNLVEMDRLLNMSMKDENDNQVLFCRICQLSFTSLNNKHSHFSGRLHRQALVDQLHQIVTAPNESGSTTSDCPSLVWQCSVQEHHDVLQLTSAQCKATRLKLAEASQHHSALFETNVYFKQQVNELEFVENNASEAMRHLISHGESMQSTLDGLSNTVASLACLGSKSKHQTLSI